MRGGGGADPPPGSLPCSALFQVPSRQMIRRLIRGSSQGLRNLARAWLVDRLGLCAFFALDPAGIRHHGALLLNPLVVRQPVVLIPDLAISAALGAAHLDGIDRVNLPDREPVGTRAGEHLARVV